MNRIRRYDSFAGKRPHFYTIINNKLLLIWMEQDEIHDVNIVTAYATHKTPVKFYTHNPSSHAGLYLFKRDKTRIYRDDISPFSGYFWNTKDKTVDFNKVNIIYPHIRPYKTTNS